MIIHSSQLAVSTLHPLSFALHDRDGLFAYNGHILWFTIIWFCNPNPYPDGSFRTFTELSLKNDRKCYVSYVIHVKRENR